MADPRPPTLQLLVAALFSRHDDALAWARRRLEERYGPIARAGPVFVFDQTTYYEASMGRDLHKQLVAFRDLIAPDRLPEIKHHTNALEREMAESGTYPEPRPLNLDPGMLGLGKFLLATTKDQAHRISLRDGIFAEVTLRYQDGAFEPWPWTYADYRLPAVRAFLAEARDYYRQRLPHHAAEAPSPE